MVHVFYGILVTRVLLYICYTCSIVYLSHVFYYVFVTRVLLYTCYTCFTIYLLHVFYCILVTRVLLYIYGTRVLWYTCYTSFPIYLLHVFYYTCHTCFTISRGGYYTKQTEAFVERGFIHNASCFISFTNKRLFAYQKWRLKSLCLIGLYRKKFRMMCPMSPKSAESQSNWLFNAELPHPTRATSVTPHTPVSAASNELHVNCLHRLLTFEKLHINKNQTNTGRIMGNKCKK